MNAAAIAASLWERPIGLNRVKNTQPAPDDRRGVFVPVWPQENPYIQLAAPLLSSSQLIIELYSHSKATCDHINQTRGYFSPKAMLLLDPPAPVFASPLVRSDPCQFQVAPSRLYVAPCFGPKQHCRAAE